MPDIRYDFTLTKALYKTMSLTDSQGHDCRDA